MTSIALDIREHPDLTEDFEDTGEDAGPAAAARAVGSADRPDLDPPARASRGPARLRCADCGTVLTADDPPGPPEPAWRIPVHAVGPLAAEPFSVRECAGSGRPADRETDTVPEPAQPPAAPPALALPTGLHWRDQPFSHGSA